MKKKFILTLLIIILIFTTIIPQKIEALPIENEESGTDSKKTSIFDSNITFKWEYVGPDETDTLPYGLISPSNADEVENLPVIVYLHGASSAKNDGGTKLKNNGIPKAILNNTTLEGFSAYILCPHIFNSNGSWTKDQMTKLLDVFIKQYNVDKQNIVIMGHSLGAISAITLARDMPDYFSKAVILSGPYAPKVSIPVQWYVGKSEIDHYKNGARSAANVYGSDAVCWLPGGHGTHSVAYNKDDGGFCGIGRK